MTGLPPGWLAEQLPEVLGREPFVQRFLGIVEEIAGSLREQIDGLENHVDVRLSPGEHVRWMGTWLARPVDTGLIEQRQRDVVATAGRELPWRGTARWLRLLLEAYTGGSVEVADTGGVHLRGEWAPHPRLVWVRLEQTGGLERRQLERLIRRELPADAWLSLRLSPSPAGASAPAGPRDSSGAADHTMDQDPPEPGSSHDVST